MLAAVAAGALTAAAVAWLGPAPPLPPAAAGAAAAALVAVLPRAGWIALAAALATWLAADQRPGTAVLLVAVAVPTAALLRRGGPLWSAPAIAPVLGLAGLSGAWPALAGQAARPWHRLALGALGAWWLVLAEAVAGERLAAGPPRDMGAWQGSTQHAWTDVLVPIVTNGALLVAALWALAALVLPYRGARPGLRAGPRRRDDLGRRARFRDAGRGPGDARSGRRRGCRRRSRRGRASVTWRGAVAFSLVASPAAVRAVCRGPTGKHQP